MSKAPNGSGSITKAKAGRYAGMYRVGVVIGRTPDGKLRRKTGHFSKHADAKAFRDEWIDKRAAGLTGPAARRTVAAVLADWLDNVIRPNREENTTASYELAIRRHINPHVGGILLESLSPRLLESWLAALVQAETGDRTRQNAYTVLSAALSHVARRGDIPANPLLRVEKPAARRERIDPFTREELDWILAESFGGSYAALFRLAVSTGMRQGEIFGLQRRDVDLDAGTLRIVRQAVEISGRVTMKDYPKTDAGNRTIPITDAAVCLMVDNRRRTLKRGKAGSGLEFVAPEGGVIHRSTFGSRVWRPMLERLAIRHRGVHHLRHSFATVMLGDRVPLHVVSRILGHAKPSITADLYAHAIPAQVDEAGNAARRLFG